MPQHPGGNVIEFPNGDHRDADLTFGGCGNPDCPTSNAPASTPTRPDLVDGFSLLTHLGAALGGILIGLALARDRR